METVQQAETRHIFLSAGLASVGERKFARLVVAMLLLAFIAVAPFVRVPLARIPPFSPGYEAALGFNYMLTAVLLFSQFVRLKSVALLALAGGYLFNPLMIIPQALSLPGVFSATGLIGTGSQTAVWLYMFEHAGFPFFVLTYASLGRRQGEPLTTFVGPVIIATIVGVTAVAGALLLLAIAGDSLPQVVFVDTSALLFGKAIGPAVLGLAIFTLLLLWRRSAPTLMELWLMVAMVAWILDITFSAILGSNRNDVGFYAGRIYGLLAASFVLGALLFEMNRLYAKVADALALAELRNIELARSREEFARVQRFEAIGQLIGGLAHDFNNLLTVITGALDLTVREASLSSKTRGLLDMSMAAAHRGAVLTGQLLTFARKQVLRPEILNPNEVIAGLETFIARAAGERIEVMTQLSPVLWPTRLDRAQFETALVNLVVNARDALNGDGRIVINTRNTVVDDTLVSDLPAGDYVLVSVSDAGAGMPPEVVAKAIEPFFTTKEIGKGSGLGLSQVYGFARAASGGLNIKSCPGQGTTVEIYLPKSVERLPRADRFLPVGVAAGEETVLVVEDDPDVLNVATRGLIDLGYKVKYATSGPEAIAILRGEDQVDVLFSDVVMPGGMNGAELAAEARRIRPQLKVLLTSGYTASALVEDHGLSARLEVLHKPYRREELATKLRLVIGGR